MIIRLVYLSPPSFSRLRVKIITRQLSSKYTAVRAVCKSRKLIETIMAWSVTLEKLIAFLRMHLAFACCWPLAPTATKKQIIYDKLFRLFNGLHSMLMICAVAYRIVSQYDNTLVIMQLGCVLGTLCEVPVQIFLFTQQHDRLQVREANFIYIFILLYIFIYVLIVMNVTQA